jgi:uncharacterized protein YegP (UPF0339 family)
MPVDFYKDMSGDWRWRLTGKNGEIVAQGEGHETQAEAHRAFTTMVSVANETLDAERTDNTDG